MSLSNSILGTKTYIRSAVPAVEKYLVTLGGFDVPDEHVGDPVPERLPGLWVISVETKTSENTSALRVETSESSRRLNEQGLTSATVHTA